MPVRVGLIGLGAMGANHARIVTESARASLHKVYDSNQSVCDRVARQWKTSAAVSLDEMADCDVVVIASATNSHAQLAESFVERRMPMLIEKPLCHSLEATLRLIDECEKSKTPLACGFVERFNPAVSTALKMVEGPVRHISTVRHSPFNPRASSGVVTDLLIHDLDLTARLAPKGMVPFVGSSVWSPAEHASSEIADCTLQYGDQMTAVQSSSRWGQRKIREMRISTDDLLLEIDLLRVTVTAYRNRSQGGQAPGELMTYRSETMIEVPFVRHTGEPLALQFDHFLDLVLGESDVLEELSTLAGPHVLADLVEKEAAQR